MALALLVLSLSLLGTWAYYAKKRSSDTVSPVVTPAGTPGMSAMAPVTAATKDSLHNIYAATIRELDIQADSTQRNLDTLKSHLVNKLEESGRLRSEITALLKGGQMNTDEVIIIKQKIATLQQKVEELRRINQDVEEENRRLKSLLAAVANRQPADAGGSFTTAQYKTATGTVPGPAGNVLVSDLRLRAVQTDNDREQETTDAQQAEKMVGSFVARGNGDAGDIMVVVLQPDGRVLQNSTWDSGSFDTREGKKIYSVKMRFDGNRGESRPYLFSIGAERFMRGNYTMQIYQNGTLIARLTKILS